MDSTVAIIIALVILVAAVIFFVVRSRKGSQLPSEEEPAALPRAQPPGVAPPPRAEPIERPVAPPATHERAAPAIAPEPTTAPTATPATAPTAALPVEPSVAAVTPSADTTAARGRVRREGDVSALKKGLLQTRTGWMARVASLFSGRKELSPELIEEIEEALLTGDVGAKTTQKLIDALKERLSNRDLSDENVVWTALRDIGEEIIDVPAPAFGARSGGKHPLVILVVGVNGVGKTTTIGKLASRYKDQGKKVYLAAGDTFRAAAVQQLEAWGKRVGVPVVKGKDLGKPSAVVFDAVTTGINEGADVVIADTAGRLHTKTPLMDELRKLRDAAAKAMPGAPHEILLVLDATTGQNGLIQVKEFRDALDLSGIVLTKLDGTAKGGVILAICEEFRLPVRFVGVGEKVDDLREFDASDFADALFTRPGEDDTAVA